MKSILLIVISATVLASSSAFAGVGGGEITFQAEGAKNVLFSHASHVQKKGLRCSECHNVIFLPKASTFSASMADIRQGQSCGVCHDGTRAFGIGGNCQRCHSR